MSEIRPPVTPAALLARLRELGIESTTVEHPAVYTVEQARKQRLGLEGTFIKNLFLRDKNGQMWLLVVREDRNVDLKSLAHRLGTKHLSFASPERLMRYLGVEPGSVTPFGLINDTEGVVSVLVDGSVLALDPVHAHPLINSQTTALSGRDLLAFIESTGHHPEIVDLDPC